MITRVNSVMVSNVALATGTDINALPINTIFVEKENFDGSRAIVTAAAGIDTNVKNLQIGIVTGKSDILNPAGTLQTVSIVEKANEIQRGSLKSHINRDYVAPVEDQIVITFGAGFVVALGHRYVLRVQRLDITEHPGTMTYQYEWVAKTTTTADLINNLARQINKDSRLGVIATATATTLTLTSMEKDDNEGKHPVNLYSQVRIDAFISYTIPTNGMVGNFAMPLNDVTVVKVPGTPGEGNWKLVRDRENVALGYRGITYRENAVYPYLAPELNVAIDGEYNTLVLEYDNKYRSPNVQYRYDTPLTIELYNPNALDAIDAILEAFITL